MARPVVVHPFGDEAISLWAEPGGPIMLKALDGADPVELNEDQAVELARLLLNLAAEIS